jgi:hypothetical protein
MSYKGGTKRWSNRYHFNGGTPSNDTQWHTLMDNIVAAEHLCLSADHTIVECIGYAAGSDVPVSSKTYSTVGTSAAAGASTPGEACALLRWSTTARTSKNHPVYLFNYFHCPIVDLTYINRDKIKSTMRTEIGTYASAWISGFSDGSHTLVRAGPNGATATGHFEETYATHRDFPYSASA